MKDVRRVEPLLEAGETAPEVHDLLAFARELGGPSEAQLAALSARVAPAVGLPLGALGGASLAVGTAPTGAAAAGAGGSGGGSLAPAAATAGVGGETLAAKLSSSLFAKASLVGLLGLGALAYVTTRTPPPVPVERVPVPPVVAEPPVPEPVLEGPGAPSEIPAEVEAAPPAQPAKPADVRKATTRPAPTRPSELSLVQAAQAARGRPSEMLLVLSRHARLYPEGMLTQERDVLRIEALVQLGRHDEAERRAEQLRRRHPGSAHLARVEELLNGPSAAP